MGMQKVAVTVIAGILASLSVGASTLNCSSGAQAPAYINSRGQWRVKADVQSPYTLRNIEIKNLRKKNLGSETKMARYDKRIGDARLFEVKPDVFCNYELVLPRNFKTESGRFTADLIMTCDDMYDGTAKLSCRVR